MINIKALLIGVGSMFFLGMLFELFFLFVDISYNILMKKIPVIKPFRQGFYYLFILSGLFFVMFSGGYLTSVYAKNHTTLNSIIAAIITCGIALYAASIGYELSFMSTLFIVMSVAFALYGNRVFIKSSTDKASS